MGQYAFINAVYTDGDENIYEIAMADTTLSNQRYKRVKLEELMQIAQTPGIVTDFYFEDGFLRCRNIPRTQLTVTVSNSLYRELPVKQSPDFQDIIRELIDKDCQFIISDVAKNLKDGDSYAGACIVPCYKIQFAATTMSAYYSVCEDNEMRNHFISRMEGDKLVSLPFYVAIPNRESLQCTRSEKVCHATLNNEEFDVFLVEPISLYGDTIILESLVNKGTALNEILRGSVAIIKKYLSSIFISDGTAQDKISWGGKGTSYSSPYGVYFKTSAKISNDEINFGALVLGSELQEAYSAGGPKTVTDTINGFGISSCAKRSLHMISNTLLQYTESYNRIEAATCLQTNLERFRAAVGSYLYMVRTQTYLSNRYVVHRFPQVLQGSDERYTTIVNEVLQCE